MLDTDIHSKTMRKKKKKRRRNVKKYVEKIFKGNFRFFMINI